MGNLISTTGEPQTVIPQIPSVSKEEILKLIQENVNMTKTELLEIIGKKSNLTPDDIINLIKQNPTGISQKDALDLVKKSAVWCDEKGCDTNGKPIKVGKFVISPEGDGNQMCLFDEVIDPKKKIACFSNSASKLPDRMLIYQNANGEQPYTYYNKNAGIFGICKDNNCGNFLAEPAVRKLIESYPRLSQDDVKNIISNNLGLLNNYVIGLIKSNPTFTIDDAVKTIQSRGIDILKSNIISIIRENPTPTLSQSQIIEIVKSSFPNLTEDNVKNIIKQNGIICDDKSCQIGNKSLKFNNFKISQANEGDICITDENDKKLGCFYNDKSSSNDRIKVFQNGDGKEPYFYFNRQNGNVGVYPTQEPFSKGTQGPQGQRGPKGDVGGISEEDKKHLIWCADGVCRSMDENNKAIQIGKFMISPYEDNGNQMCIFDGSVEGGKRLACFANNQSGWNDRMVVYKNGDGKLPFWYWNKTAQDTDASYGIAYGDNKNGQYVDTAQGYQIYDPTDRNNYLRNIRANWGVGLGNVADTIEEKGKRGAWRFGKINPIPN